MRLIYIITFFVIHGSLLAQNGVPPTAGARGGAMGTTGIAFQDINGAMINQAALASIEKFSVGIFGEQRFLLTDLNSFTAMAAIPTNSGTFGVHLSHFGNDAYREQKVGLAYARKFAEKVSIGAQVDYLNTNINEFGNRGVLTFELGLQIQVFKSLRVASHIFNPIRSEITIDESLPTVFKIGAAYTPADNMMVSIELEKDLDYEIRVKTGVEYQFLEVLAFRVGFATNPNILTFGVGTKIGDHLQLDFGTTYHQVLGFSPSFGAVYALDNRK